MEIETKPYGKMTVHEKLLINFPYGIPGFEEYKKFVLLDAEQASFFWLQSIENKDLAFILVDPQFFRPDYFLNVSSFDLNSIKIDEKDADILVLSIVTIRENSEMTANLAGPIIINRKNKEARQVINDDAKWLVRHFIKEELANLQDESSKNN